MKKDKKSHIIEIISKKGSARPNELIQILGITPAAVHRHLKELVSQNKLVKFGRPPLVFYGLLQEKAIQTKASLVSISSDKIDFINQQYLYVSPEGQMMYGIEGFKEWVHKTGQKSSLDSLAHEFIQHRLKANQFFDDAGWIHAQQKMVQTFSEVFTDIVLYQDFYSLPKFGKTKLGQLVLHAKQAQDKKLINYLAQISRPILQKIISHYEIQAIGWIPHSIPRKLSFLKEYERQVNIQSPTIKIAKAYAGQVPVAQKSLSKLDERIENARKTIFVKDEQIPYSHILLVDDAVGSGATLNEVAQKLKRFDPVKKIIGFAIVGSYKGFEVIKEI